EIALGERLKGKKAMILGGGTGLGKACAEAMVDEGAAVFISGRRVEKLAQVVDALAGRGRIAYAGGDATDEAQVRRVIDAAVAFMGGLDTLVVSSGVSAIGTALNTTIEDFRRVIDTNLLPLFLGAKHAAPHMSAAGGGSIIAIASVTGVAGMRER